MKNVKPMLGALTIVGKDSLGRKLILPTGDKKIKSETDNKKRPAWIKRLVNIFKRTDLTYNKLGVVIKRQKHKLTKRDCQLITNSFLAGVHEKVLAAQEEWRRQRRIMMGFEKP
jgi:hypothetical protein